MKKGFLTVLISVALSGLTAYGIVKAANPEQERITYSSDGQAVKTVNLSLSDYPDFTYAAENAVEAVVYVEVTVKSQSQPSNIDPFFRFFFGGDPYGESQPRERVRKGSGSGVIIRSDGYIVTNNHVVENASSIEVTLNNDKTYTANVIGGDPATDVALLKIDAENLPAISFADSDKLRLGEWVLAIGSPLGEELRSTITAGIVSAKGRSMGRNPNEDPTKLKIESFIQTDAAVNPGNSGGALVNKEGQLVGINTAIISTTGSYAGYSFAVPSNIVSKVVADLIDFGSVKRATLGVSIITLNDKVAKELNADKEFTAKYGKVPEEEGVYVSDVSKGGSADKAGIKSGDIIIAIDGASVLTSPLLQEKVNSFRPGDKASVTVRRDGKKLVIPVEFIENSAANGNGLVDDEGFVSFYGAKLRAVKNGVEIVSAGSGKLAQAGGEDGFIIQYVNDQKVSKPEDVIDIAKKSRRAIFIEGITSTGRPGYFGFGKED